ncbi:MAG: glycyl-radical enzyme activating protein [Clostridia bacterium]|nr:glycyl-radical enzyme activating protein [Clostridia bacterium]
MDYLKAKGRIFDIQRYSIHDGPGIRTIVFLKGCPLRCRWCCNPEGQNYKIEQMTVNGEIKTYGEDITVEELMPKLICDEFYFRRSGGGITLSGGECLAQPDFAPHILHACKDLGYNTAIETTGYSTWENIEKYLPYTDYVLMDIKHMNSAKHKEFCGVENAIIHENAMKFAKSGVNLTIRVPVIPGFNNTPEEITDIANFAATLPGVTNLHLLPYHRLGEGKYEGLGREYLLHGIEPMDKEYMNMLLEVAKKSGLKCQIGG